MVVRYENIVVQQFHLHQGCVRACAHVAHRKEADGLDRSVRYVLSGELHQKSNDTQNWIDVLVRHLGPDNQQGEGSTEHRRRLQQEGANLQVPVPLQRQPPVFGFRAQGS